jgi:hypothetical protein
MSPLLNKNSSGTSLFVQQDVTPVPIRFAGGQVIDLPFPAWLVWLVTLSSSQVSQSLTGNTHISLLFNRLCRVCRARFQWRTRHDLASTRKSQAETIRAASASLRNPGGSWQDHARRHQVSGPERHLVGTDGVQKYSAWQGMAGRGSRAWWDPAIPAWSSLFGIRQRGSIGSSLTHILQ